MFLKNCLVDEWEEVRRESGRPIVNCRAEIMGKRDSIEDEET